MGLGVGTSSLAARAIGAGNKTIVREIATHAMILSIVVGVFVITAGLLSIEQIFSLLGANEETCLMSKNTWKYIIGAGYLWLYL